MCLSVAVTFATVIWYYKYWLNVFFLVHSRHCDKQLNLLTPATYVMSPRKVHCKATFYLRDFLLCKFVVKIAGFSVVRVARSSLFYVHILFYRSLFFLCLFLYVIVLSVLRFTNSDYPFDIFKHLFVLLSFFFLSLCFRSFFDLRILITPLISSNTYLSFCPFSFCHCVVGPSSIYGFWLPLWYLQTYICPFVLFLFVIVLSVLLRFTDSDYPFDIFKHIFVLLSFFFLSLCCRSFFDLPILITPLISSNTYLSLCPFSFCHCVVGPSSIYGFWLPLWYLQTHICPFVLFLFVIVLSVLLRFTDSDYPFDIFKHIFVLLSFFFLSLCCRSFFDLRILITPLISSNTYLSFCPFSFCHCVVGPSSIYGFWLPLWYLQTHICPFVLFLFVIVLSVLLRFTDSDYPFDIFKHIFVLLSFFFLSLCCRSFFDLRILITPLISSNTYLSFCPFSFCHCVVGPSSIYDSDYPFDIFKHIFVLLSFFFLSLCCRSFFDLRILITPLISSNTYLSFCPFSFCHCVVGPSSIYGFWLPLWYLQTHICPFVLFLFVIVLSVLLRFTDSDYPFDIFKHIFVLLSFFFLSLCCRSFFDLRILITPLISSNTYLSFCPFSFCHCVVGPSSIYGFWLPLWYLQTHICPFVLFLFVIVLSVLLRFTDSDYPFDIFKHIFVLLSFFFLSLCCRSFFDLRILITPLISSNTYLSFCPFSFCHCVVGPSSIYGFWLPLWYLQTHICPFVLFLFVIVLSVLLRFTDSDYPFDIFKHIFVLLSFFFLSLCCRSFFDLRILITPLISSNTYLSFCPFSFCHCVVGPSSIYGFWLPLWYLQTHICPFVLFLLVIVLSVLLRFTDSDYPNGIFKFFFVLFLYAIVFQT